MLAVQNLSKIAPKIASTAIQQARNNHAGYAIVSKPRNRVSFVEKLATGIFMTIASLTIPVVISMNFNKWREARGE